MTQTDTHSRWACLSVIVPAAAEEVATSAFLPDDVPGRAFGIVIEDSECGALATTGAPPPAGFVRISTYVTHAEGASIAARIRSGLQALVDHGVLAVAPEVAVTAVTGDDWQERWKEFFHVQRVGQRVVIRPPWREHVAATADVVIEIEPGLAFGTGGHQTTQLCLEALEAAFDGSRAPRRVLDVGTGSGVLAIGAVLLGAELALGLDTDPAAIEATLENAARNGVSDRVAASLVPLADLVHGGAGGTLAAPPFDLVLANIISGVLRELRADLIAAVAPGGRIVLAGILESEEDAFRAAFDGPEVALVWRAAMDGWLGLAYERRSSSAEPGA